ncbi:MAG: prephenate dehydrogenase [Janthinobacterium lividum]
MTDDADFPGHFGTVAIIGVGLIGGSLGMALKSRRLAHRIIGVERSESDLKTAVAFRAIDYGTTRLEEGVSEADVIVLSTPVGHILEILPEILAAAKSGAVVTDVGSTKAAIVRQAGSTPFFVGSHPMAGTEQSGVEAANPLLFEEATWAITPIDATDPQAVLTIQRLAQSVGATTLILSPDSHDSMLAVTSHLPHVLATSLMRQAFQTQNRYPQTQHLTAGSFADGTRVAASSPEIWRDVCLSNRDALLQALKAFRGELDTLEAAIADGDAEQIEAFFASGVTAKRGWGSL